MMELPTKECNTCGEQVPLINFTRSKNRFDGLAARCKSCSKAKQKLTESQILSKNSIIRKW